MMVRTMALQSIIFALVVTFFSCNYESSRKEEQAREKAAEELKKSATEVDVNLSFEDMGLNFSNSTKSVLGENLMEAITKYGSDGAVQFCNTRAIPLTDSMARVYNSTIRRVSDKPRNLNNFATESELNFINEQREKLARGEKAVPHVFERDGMMTGYYPILTNNMCLQCHGKKEVDINTATINKINEFYPDDKATGYSENEIRGIFVVEMARK